jgi:hypothetical protein
MISMLLALAITTINLTTPDEVDRFVVSRSAMLCSYAESRALVQAAIEREKRHTKIAGVENLTLLYKLQSQAGQIDDVTEAIRAILKKADMKPKACTDPMVKRVGACLDIGFMRSSNELDVTWLEDGECASAELKAYRFE